MLAMNGPAVTNYGALSEPWVTSGSSVNGTSVRQSPWVLDVSAS